MSTDTARLIASLELQDKNFTRGIKNVERGIGRVDKKLGAFSGAVNRNVGRAVDNVTARLLEVPGAVISAAVEQESAITGIRKTVVGDIGAITDELKKLSTETGSTFTELAGIAELGGAMGIAGEDIGAFTKQVAILGATTDVSVEDAATALGQLQNVIGLTGDEFDNFTASLVDLGNKGASTESQILEIAKRSGGAARLVGVAKEETLGWASAAANLGLNSELAGTALQNFFIKGAQAQAGLAAVAGVNVKKFKKLFAKDATGALQLFLKGLGKLDKEKRIKAIQEIFGKGSGLTRLILGLAGDTDNLTDSLNDGTEAWEKGTAAQEEADKRFKTSEFLFKRLNNSVNLAAATIGAELLPVLNDLATEGMEWLNKPATQKGIKDFAVGLGKGVRALAGIITSINWSAVAGFLSTAAGFAGQLVTWFTKMPDWAQAFLIGGFAVTKLPVIGDLFSSLASGLIKGVLGMTAGVVHINAGTVVGGPGGAPVPGGPGGGLLGTAKNLIVPVTIAAIAIGAAKVLSEAIDPSFGNPPGGPNDRPLANRDPRRFDPQGRVTNQWLSEIAGNTDRIPGVGDRPSPGNPGLTRAIIELKKGFATGQRPHGPPPPAPKELTAKQQATINAVKNAQSIASRENSAQKTELANIKNASATLNTTTNTGLTTVSTGITTAAAAAGTAAAGITNTARMGLSNTAVAARNAGVTTANAMTNAANRIVTAVNGLDLSVNVTTVNRTSTVNNRYGPSGGSSTTQRAYGPTG